MFIYWYLIVSLPATLPAEAGYGRVYSICYFSSSSDFSCSVFFSPDFCSPNSFSSGPPQLWRRRISCRISSFSLEACLLLRLPSHPFFLPQFFLRVLYLLPCSPTCPPKLYRRRKL